ncbi:Conserved_hypothetical protein [Hexamita inflata]|uniref:WD40-repeat-containing domain n=1 Tax=Hexamita inflata TaxID=28002 RepID=A0ABP1JVL7_9EUKA
MLFNCCNVRKSKFISENFEVQQPIDRYSAIYGTNSGKLYLYNYFTFKSKYLANINQEINTITNHQNECYIGTKEGNIFVIRIQQQQSSKPLLVGSMTSSIQKLYIQGYGINRKLFALNQQNMLYCYELDTVRSSFIQQNLISELQLKISCEQEGSDISQELQSIDGVTPTFIKQFKSKPIYFHGFENILAVCCVDGNIKLYSLITNQLIYNYNYKVGIPMCCYLHQQIIQNQIQVFCEIGYQSGEVVSLNVNKQSSQKFRFWKTKFDSQINLVDYETQNSKKPVDLTQEENSINYNNYSKQQVQQLQLQQSKNINQIFGLLDTAELEADNNDDDEETKLLILSKNDLDRINFSSIKALWMDDKYIAVADENSVSYFIKQYVQGTHQGYMLLNKYKFEQIPTRYQFKMFNDILMFYGICNGNVLRLKIVNNKWIQQIVE